MKIRLRTPVMLSGLVVVLFLTLFLSAQALSPEPAGGDATAPAPAATPPPLDCTKPLPGKVTRLLQDDEIVVFGAVDAAAGWDDSGTMQLDKLENAGDGSMNLVYDWDWEGPTHDILWPAVTTADLDADGKDEVVGVGKFQDINGTLDVQAMMNPEVSNSANLQVYGLTGWNVLMQGAELNHFDIAAGNLKRTANGAEQAAVAFRDNNGNLHVLLTESNTSGGLDWFGEWWCSSACSGFNGVGDVSVDVGDLDGDGYNDEIVVAFVDGNAHLNVVVFEWNGGGLSLNGLAQNYWTDNNRAGLNLNYAAGIDVTVGNFNADPADEIAVAFRDGSASPYRSWRSSTLQPAVTSPARGGGATPAGAAIMSTCSPWPPATSTATGSMRSSPPFRTRRAISRFVTLDADTGSPTLRGSWENGSDDRNGIRWTSVDAGDIDKDAKAEVVVSFEDGQSQLQVISYDDNPACPCADDGASGLTQHGKWEDPGDGRKAAGMTWIALGDLDGDSVFADYTGVCAQTADVRMTALVGRPPFWAAWNPTGNEVGYGKSAGSESESDQEVTTSYGASATVDLSFDLEGVELGPSITKDWERSVTSSTSHGHRDRDARRLEHG